MCGMDMQKVTGKGLKLQPQMSAQKGGESVSAEVQGRPWERRPGSKMDKGESRKEMQISQQRKGSDHRVFAHHGKRAYQEAR